MKILIITLLVHAGWNYAELNINIENEEDMKGLGLQNIPEEPSQPSRCVVSVVGDVVILNCSRVPFAEVVFDNVDKFIDILDVSHTGLKTLEKINQPVNSRFKQLSILNASHNGITDLPKDVFSNLNYLEKIDLSHNKIGQIADNLFVTMDNLRFLDLSNNKLHTLPNALPMMEWFDVSNNLLTKIPESYSSVLYPQTVFLLGGNPFVCSCELLWLKDLLSTRMYLLTYMHHIDKQKFMPLCGTPKDLEGKSWDVLEDLDFQCEGVEHEDFNVANKVPVSNKVHTSEFNIHVSDIGPSWIVVKWTDQMDNTGSSVEIKFRKFGQSKDSKTVIIPISATGYRLKNLEDNSPYVICFSVIIGSNIITLDCVEVKTLEIVKDLNFYFNAFLEVIFGYFKHIFFILLMTGIVCLILWRLDNKEKKN